MKKIFLLTIGFQLLFCSGLKAQFWQPTGALASTTGQYLIATCHLDDNIFVVANNQVFARSADKGQTWSQPAITPPNGAFVSLHNGGDRIYANMKINTYDFELHYSMDNGTSWTLDTIGLPQNTVNTGKRSLNVANMGNGYLMAYDGTSARYKQAGDINWITTTIDFVIADVTSMNDKWYAIGPEKILKSTNHGSNWTQITTSGLPTGFQGYKLATNREGRLFISEAPSGGGEDIYFSDDEGASWTLTNATGHYTHGNPWVNYIYAVGDYVFASILPESFNFQDPPPYIMSSTSQPNFMAGDISGLPTGSTTSALPLFFHIENNLYTMFGDIYSSTPGFPATVSLSETSDIESKIYPNPVSETLNLDAPINSQWTILTIDGKFVSQGVVSSQTNQIKAEYLDKGVYLLKLENHGVIKTERFIKN